MVEELKGKNKSLKKSLNEQLRYKQPLHLNLDEEISESRKLQRSMSANFQAEPGFILKIEESRGVFTVDLSSKLEELLP